MAEKFFSTFLVVMTSLVLVSGCGQTTHSPFETEVVSSQTQQEETLPPTESENPSADSLPFSFADIPAYEDRPYIQINDNKPYFLPGELTTVSFEQYASLDTLGRCGVAVASVGWDLMPTEERGPIGMVKPSGWHTVKYDCVDGKYLYNRCHLIGYQLSGENANIRNLITGTRYLNVEGMLPFENLVADYVKETRNHVVYRVTPVYDGCNLVASGVLMEGYSVEDWGQGIEYCVYVYNVQPGVAIDYATGKSALAGREISTPEVSPAKQSPQAIEISYILNINTGKFHYPDCSSVKNMNEENKRTFTGSREELIRQGYSPCGRCCP